MIEFIPEHPFIDIMYKCDYCGELLGITFEAAADSAANTWVSIGDVTFHSIACAQHFSEALQLEISKRRQKEAETPKSP